MENEIDFNYKSILISTFSALVDLLESHNLRWFVGFGTLLGTIRHSGLIPWDDDIDIIMPREDYYKLINLYNSETNNYYIKTIDDVDYPFAFAKFCHKYSTIVETKTIPCVFGIYIDIFPIDNLGLRYDELKKIKLRYQSVHKNYERSLNKYSLPYIFSLVTGLRLINLLVFIKDVLWHRPLSSYYLREMKKMETVQNSNYTSYLVVLSGVYGIKDIYKKEWFSDYIYMNFEEISVRVPIGYDAYLNNIYGDYMKLPPIKERIPKHKHVYENLHEGMSHQEARTHYDNSISKRNSDNE